MLLSRAWKIYRANLLLITLVVTIVWLPCELFDSYMSTFVIPEDDFMRSIKLSQFLENFFGIIATSGVLSLALGHASGGTIGLGRALGAGLRLWPKMWWTRFLSTLVLVISTLLLIVPLFIVYPRLVLAECVVVGEHGSGVAALKRSFELTRGCYWPLFRLALVLILILSVVSIALVMIPDFIPSLDHWLAHAVLYLICDIVVAYEAVVLFCAYQACLNRHREVTTPP